MTKAIYRKRCPHGRDRYQCKDCRANGICPHLHQKSYCFRCNPESIYRVYKNSAKKRNLIFELTVEEFVSMIFSPCIYCGETPCGGVDRLDNEIGYTSENSAPCCGIDNFAKRAQSKQQYLDHVQRIYRYQRGEKS